MDARRWTDTAVHASTNVMKQRPFLTHSPHHTTDAKPDRPIDEWRAAGCVTIEVSKCVPLSSTCCVIGRAPFHLPPAYLCGTLASAVLHLPGIEDGFGQDGLDDELHAAHEEGC